MWHRKRSRIFLDIFLVILILAVGFAMFWGYRDITQKQAEQDLALAELASKAKQESQIAREENYASLEEAYRKDLDTVENFLPGIVCWGDVLTEGTASGISYPKTLQSLINQYLVEEYDFRSTVENPYQYTRVDWTKFTASVPVVNMGTGKESTQTVLGRCGAAPYLISRDFTIPADCSPVPVYFTGYDGQPAKPLISGDLGVNPVVIGGIEGTLTADPDSYSDYSNGKYTFTRTAPGAETEIGKGTEIVTASSELYRDYISVIFIGSYGKYHDAEELAAQVKLMVSRQLKNTDRFIIIGNYAGPFRSANFYDQFSALMTQEYGERFLNFRKYLMNEALPEFGIKSTDKDTTNIRHGQIPFSVLVTGSETELQSFLYDKLGEMVFARMDSLGYFDEVREELGIRSVKEIDAALAKETQR